MIEIKIMLLMLLSLILMMLILQCSPYSSPHPSSFCGISFIEKFRGQPAKQRAAIAKILRVRVFHGSFRVRHGVVGRLGSGTASWVVWGSAIRVTAS